MFYETHMDNNYCGLQTDKHSHGWLKVSIIQEASGISKFTQILRKSVIQCNLVSLGWTNLWNRMNQKPWYHIMLVFWKFCLLFFFFFLSIKCWVSESFPMDKKKKKLIGCNQQDKKDQDFLTFIVFHIYNKILQLGMHHIKNLNRYQ